ncbi:MAG: MATE family efflux transporter [Eubacterium sp.]
MGSDVVAASAVAPMSGSVYDLVFRYVRRRGSAVGKNNWRKAYGRSRASCGWACRIALLVGIITALIIIAIRPLILTMFDLSETATGYLGVMLLISSYYIIGQAMNTLTIAGIFRAGGDSRFGLICDTIVMWAISVPLGFLSAFVFHWPPLVVDSASPDVKVRL